jgi:hypothetical protein
MTFPAGVRNCTTWSVSYEEKKSSYEHHSKSSKKIGFGRHKHSSIDFNEFFKNSQAQLLNQLNHLNLGKIGEKNKFTLVIPIQEKNLPLGQKTYNYVFFFIKSLEMNDQALAEKFRKIWGNGQPQDLFAHLTYLNGLAQENQNLREEKSQLQKNFDEAQGFSEIDLKKIAELEKEKEELLRQLNKQ